MTGKHGLTLDEFLKTSFIRNIGTDKESDGAAEFMKVCEKNSPKLFEMVSKKASGKANADVDTKDEAVPHAADDGLVPSADPPDITTDDLAKQLQDDAKAEPAPAELVEKPSDITITSEVLINQHYQCTNVMGHTSFGGNVMSDLLPEYSSVLNANATKERFWKYSSISNAFIRPCHKISYPKILQADSDTNGSMIDIIDPSEDVYDLSHGSRDIKLMKLYASPVRVADAQNEFSHPYSDTASVRPRRELSVMVPYARMRYMKRSLELLTHVYEDINDFKNSMGPLVYGLFEIVPTLNALDNEEKLLVYRMKRRALPAEHSYDYTSRQSLFVRTFFHPVLGATHREHSMAKAGHYIPTFSPSSSLTSQNEHFTIKDHTFTAEVGTLTSQSGAIYISTLARGLAGGAGRRFSFSGVSDFQGTMYGENFSAYCAAAHLIMIPNYTIVVNDYVLLIKIALQPFCTLSLNSIESYLTGNRALLRADIIRTFTNANPRIRNNLANAILNFLDAVRNNQRFPFYALNRDPAANNNNNQGINLPQKGNPSVVNNVVDYYRRECATHTFVDIQAIMGVTSRTGFIATQFSANQAQAQYRRYHDLWVDYTNIVNTYGNAMLKQRLQLLGGVSRDLVRKGTNLYDASIHIARAANNVHILPMSNTPYNSFVGVILDNVETEFSRVELPFDGALSFLQHGFALKEELQNKSPGEINMSPYASMKFDAENVLDDVDGRVEWYMNFVLRVFIEIKQRFLLTGESVEVRKEEFTDLCDKVISFYYKDAEPRKFMAYLCANNEEILADQNNPYHNIVAGNVGMRNVQWWQDYLIDEDMPDDYVNPAPWGGNPLKLSNAATPLNDLCKGFTVSRRPMRPSRFYGNFHFYSRGPDNLQSLFRNRVPNSLTYEGMLRSRETYGTDQLNEALILQMLRGDTFTTNYYSDEGVSENGVDVLMATLSDGETLMQQSQLELNTIGAPPNVARTPYYMCYGATQERAAIDLNEEAYVIEQSDYTYINCVCTVDYTSINREPGLTSVQGPAVTLELKSVANFQAPQRENPRDIPNAMFKWVTSGKVPFPFTPHNGDRVAPAVEVHSVPSFGSNAHPYTNPVEGHFIVGDYPCINMGNEFNPTDITGPQLNSPVVPFPRYVPRTRLYAGRVVSNASPDAYQKMSLLGDEQVKRTFVLRSMFSKQDIVERSVCHKFSLHKTSGS